MGYVQYGKGNLGRKIKNCREGTDASVDVLLVNFSCTGNTKPIAEKVGSLGRSLTRSDKQTTTKSGDIILYSGGNIVVFYGSNSWSYTCIGRIDDLTDWEEALGSGDVMITFRK